MFLSDRFVIQHQHMLHILRIVIACAIALAVIRIFNFPHSNWALITIIVVMGPISYLGSVLTKANQRLSGTIIGAALGLALYILPAGTTLLHDILLLLILAVAMYAVKGKYSYAAVLVALTLFLVAGPDSSEIEVAQWRAINVIWGSLLSIACSRLFFPSRALVHFQLLVTEFLQLCADYYLMHNRDLNNNNQLTDYNLKILSLNLAEQRSLMIHIYKEWKGNNQDITDIVVIERRVLSVLETLINREWRSQNAVQKIREDAQLIKGAEELFEQINKLSIEVDMGKVQQLLMDDIPLLAVTNETFSSINNNDYMNNFNFSGYLWLNHELARHISCISFSLSSVFNARRFKIKKAPSCSALIRYCSAAKQLLATFINNK
ncbi:MAG: FUSC family protein [Psychromonas sp.]|nr:FUSC family protein [Psychromonas sp.]